MQKILYVFTSLVLIFCADSHAQQDSARVIVKANATRTGIVQLRWLANVSSAWRYTNTCGVTIERYTLMRNGYILDVPEKVVLTPVPLKPPVLSDWKDIVQKDPKAAIIAQALYGKDFEVSGGRAGVGEMIAL